MLYRALGMTQRAMDGGAESTKRDYGVRAPIRGLIFGTHPECPLEIQAIASNPVPNPSSLRVFILISPIACLEPADMGTVSSKFHDAGLE